MASAATDSQSERETPKTMVARPNTATPANMVTPALERIGRAASTRAMRVAPMAGAARNRPKPSSPTCRMSRAKTGSRAVAPPSSTANRSSEMAPNTIFWRHT